MKAEEFMRACKLLGKQDMAENHVYLGVVKGKQVLCTEGMSFEKAESVVLELIDKNEGCVKKEDLMEEMAMPITVCEEILKVGDATSEVMRRGSRRVGRLCEIREAPACIITEICLSRCRRRRLRAGVFVNKQESLL